jgi:hypothetical protein
VIAAIHIPGCFSRKTQRDFFMLRKKSAMIRRYEKTANERRCDYEAFFEVQNLPHEEDIIGAVFIII